MPILEKIYFFFRDFFFDFFKKNLNFFPLKPAETGKKCIFSVKRGGSILKIRPST